jgi:hypothetical protein
MTTMMSLAPNCMPMPGVLRTPPAGCLEEPSLDTWLANSRTPGFPETKIITGSVRPTRRGCGTQMRDGTITYQGEPTPHDYWTVAGSVDLNRNATGRASSKAVGDYDVAGHSPTP